MNALSFLVPLAHFGRHSFSDLSENEKTFWFSFPFVLAAIYVIYQVIRNRTKYKFWFKGSFPADLPGNDLNLMMAHLCAAVLLIHRDRSILFRKLGFVDSWFKHHFPKVEIKSKEYFEEALENPVSAKSLVSWLKKSTNKAQKDTFIKFITDIAYYDGMVNDKEYEFLVYCADFLECRTLLDELIAEKQQYKEREYKSAAPKSTSKRNDALETLGLSESATQSDIKSAYRRLAKICHPDKFQQEPEEIRQEAHKKFLEIQSAFEYLSTHS